VCSLSTDAIGIAFAGSQGTGAGNDTGDSAAAEADLSVVAVSDMEDGTRARAESMRGRRSVPMHGTETTVCGEEPVGQSPKCVVTHAEAMHGT
jgi:hypothetical protein